jgi:hypothetical protein
MSRTPRRKQLGVRAKDAWRLMGAALEVDQEAAARTYADEAMAGSSWDRYNPGLFYREAELFYSSLIPAEWCYYGIDTDDHGDIRCLLINDEVGPMVSDWDHLATVMDVAAELGGGLLRLSEVLAEAIMRGMTAPDDASELTAT